SKLAALRSASTPSAALQVLAHPWLKRGKEGSSPRTSSSSSLTSPPSPLRRAAEGVGRDAVWTDCSAAWRPEPLWSEKKRRTE
ncbi:MAG: hypothetical protein SGPRY_008010, partial [Prymnesium sp.]